MKIEFAHIPAVGLGLLVDGRRFDLIGHEDHRTRDGRDTILLVWSGNCADCDAAFVTRSPSTKLPESKRCEQHRQPGIRARRL